MLHHMGGPKPPRKYPITANLADTASVSRESCNLCKARIWMADLFRNLNNAWEVNPDYTHHCRIGSDELRKSVVEGCRFCRTVADGIYGKLFFDVMEKRFARTDSWPESENSEAGNSSLEESDLNRQHMEGVSPKTDSEGEEAEGESTGGLDLWEDRDILMEKCIFELDIMFHKGTGGKFANMTVCIKAIDEELSDKDASKPCVFQSLRDGNTVDLEYQVNVTGTDPLATKLFPSETGAMALGTDGKTEILKSWIQDTHQFARIAENSLYLPSRLIEICVGGSLRVTETSNIGNAEFEFAALSYVWGTNQTFILKSDTEHLLMSSFEMIQLPQTIQDAVTVTRHIGVRYLWVDALCIMQDSNKDKAMELPKMRHIYQLATVTIVAAISNSASEGFLHKVEEPRYFIHPITIPFLSEEQAEKDTSLVVGYKATYERWRDPINDRAWTFQELVLSTRAIIFSYCGIRFLLQTPRSKDFDLITEKYSGMQLQNLPWNDPQAMPDQTSYLIGSLQSQNAEERVMNTRKTWLSIRGEYSRRRLTYQTDKLLGIAAVAEEISRFYDSKYLAGMWENDLLIDLQWSCNYYENIAASDQRVRKPRAKEYIAPSWSWASVDAQLEDFTYSPEDEGFKDSLGFEVVACDVEHVVSGFTFGAIRSGVLVVKARVHSFFWRPHKEHDPLHDDNESDGYLAVRAHHELYSENMVGDALLDASDPELEDGVVVDFMATRLVEKIPGKDQVEGLVLLPADDERHRRVGFAKVWVPVLFHDAELMEVTIV